MDNYYEDLGIIDEESRKRINEMLDDPGVLEAADKVVKNSTWYKKHYRMITDEEINDMIKDFRKKVESGNLQKGIIIDSIDLGEISNE